MAITNNGITDTYEFELPKNLADELVTAVDIAGGKITVQSTYSANRKGAGTANKTYKIGDLYDGNLGELVGRTVNIGVNSDGEVTTFSVNDAEVVFEAVQAKEGNDSATFGDSNKDYLVAPDKSKYYWSIASDETSAVTQTYVLDVKGNDWTISPNADDKFDYDLWCLSPTWYTLGQLKQEINR